MKLVTSLTLAAALLAAAPGAYAGPCDTEAANNSYLCNAWRPMPGIQATPTAPRIGSPVVLETSATSRGSTLAWDLDGDGEFDDATGTKVTTTFNAAPARVGVRETDQFGRTGSQTITLPLHAFNASPSGSVSFSAGSARVGRPVTVTAEGYDPDGQIAHVDLDIDGDGTYETEGAEHVATYATPGTRVVKARFTDDVGATATASATIDVHAENLAPRVQLQIGQANGLFDEAHPIAAGGAIINAFAGDPDGTIAAIDFDLDGDGTYETPAQRRGGTPSGEMGTATRTFEAGDYEIGVRVTDSDGAMTVARRTLIVGATTRPVVLPTFAGRVLRPGVPTTFGAAPDPGVTTTWDADGDGAFDDGTGTIQFTYPAPGEYTVRVKATGPGGERIGMATVSVREAPDLPPVLGPLFLPRALRAGKAVGFDAAAGTADGMHGDIDLTFDLDGDGNFNEDPSGQFGYSWTFPGHTEIAVKATDGAQRTAVRTVELSPLTQNLGPLAGWVAFPIGFPSPDAMGELAFLAGKTSTLESFPNDVDGGGCCTLAWDADGDGQYDDATGNELMRTFSAGEHTVGVRATDTDGDSSTMTRTFTVGTHPPKASFTVSGSTVTSTSTDPDGDAIASIQWDLDGDRDFDDASGPSARALEGAHLVGLKVTDPTGDIGITYANVTGDTVAQPGPPPPCACAPPPKPPLQLTVIAGRTPKLAAVLKSGLSVTVRCSASCRTTVVASVDKKTAKKLHLRSRNVGRGIGFGGAVRVKLNSEAKRALKRVKSVKLLLTITAVGSDGLGAAASQTVTLKR